MRSWNAVLSIPQVALVCFCSRPAFATAPGRNACPWPPFPKGQRQRGPRLTAQTLREQWAWSRPIHLFGKWGHTVSFHIDCREARRSHHPETTAQRLAPAPPRGCHPCLASYSCFFKNLDIISNFQKSCKNSRENSCVPFTQIGTFALSSSFFLPTHNFPLPQI